MSHYRAVSILRLTKCTTLFSTVISKQKHKRQLTSKLWTLQHQLLDSSTSSTALNQVPELPLRQCRKQQMSKSREHPQVPSAGRQLGGHWGTDIMRRVSIEHFSSDFEYLARNSLSTWVQRLNPKIQSIVNRNTDFTVTLCLCQT